MNWEMVENDIKENNMEDSFIYAIFTDQIVIDKLPLKEDIKDKKERVLELRIFNAQKEYKYIFSSKIQDYRTRLICDENEDYFDEIQYVNSKDQKIIKEKFGKEKLKVRN